MSLTLALLLASSTTEPTACRAALEAVWPELVERLEDPVMERVPRPARGVAGIVVPERVSQAISEAARLQLLCRSDTEASEALRSYEANQRLRIQDFLSAYRLLEGRPVGGRRAWAALDAGHLLLAAIGVGESEYRQAVQKVRAAHQAMATSVGFIQTGSTQFSDGWIDSYRKGGVDPARIFIAWPDTAMPMVLQVIESEGRHIDQLVGCGDDGAPMNGPTIGMSDTEALALARKSFEWAKTHHDWRADFGGEEWNDVRTFCTSLYDLLPAFGPPDRLIGDEFKITASQPTSAQIVRLLYGSPTQRLRGQQAVFDHPGSVHPIHLLPVVGDLWGRGDRLTAALLYYIWEMRFGPWAKLGSPSNEGALFVSLRAEFRPIVQRWIGSDPAVQRQVLERALAFERRFPLYAERPKGVDEKTWLRTIEEVRASATKEWLGGMPVTPEELKNWAKRRSENGLPNGPVEHPGKPLPDHWQ